MKTASRSEMEVLAKKLVAPVVTELLEGQEELRASVRTLAHDLQALRESLRDFVTTEEAGALRSDTGALRADTTRLIQQATDSNLAMHEVLDDKLMQQRLSVAGIDDKVKDQRKELQQTEQTTLRRVKLLEDLTPTIRATQLAHDKVHERMLARFEQLENLSVQNHSEAINKIAESMIGMVAQAVTRGE